MHIKEFVYIILFEFPGSSIEEVREKLKSSKEKPEGRLTTQAFERVRADSQGKDGLPWYASTFEMQEMMIKARRRMDARRQQEVESAELAKKHPVGSLVTPLALSKVYNCEYAADVLDDHLTPIPKQKGERTKFNVQKPLPAVSTYPGLRGKKYETTIGKLLVEAKSDLEDLKEELGEWFDALNEGLQATDKGQRLDEAVRQMDTALDNFGITPVMLATVPLVYLPGRQVSSRRSRVAETNAQLQAAIKRSQEVLGAMRLLVPVTQALGLTKDQENKLQSIIEECEEYLNGIHEAYVEIESIDIPGMYD